MVTITIIIMVTITITITTMGGGTSSKGNLKFAREELDEEMSA